MKDQEARDPSDGAEDLPLAPGPGVRPRWPRENLLLQGPPGMRVMFDRIEYGPEDVRYVSEPMVAVDLVRLLRDGVVVICGKPAATEGAR